MKAPAIAAAPVLVSDRTSATVLGVPWRTLRVFLEERQIPIHKIGRRSVVSVAAVVAALEGTSKPAWSEADVVRMMSSGRGSR